MKLVLPRLQVIFFALFVFHACANQLLFDENETLKEPIGLMVSPQGAGFEISYQVQNSEPTFIGYNLYISPTPIADADIYILPTYSKNGALPSFEHSPLNATNQKILVEKFYEINSSYRIEKKFEHGKTYYFRLCAYSRFGKLSLPSEQRESTFP